MRRITKNRAFFWSFIVLWGALILWNFLVPETTFSEGENRALAPLPNFSTNTFLDGEYMDDMNTYLNDQFVVRDLWVSGMGLMEYGLGKREINDVFIGKDALFRNYPAENTTVSGANVDGINAFATETGIPTAVMLVPSSTWIQRAALPSFADPWNEEAYINTVYGSLLPQIAKVDAASALTAHREEYIYYRTDHHWTTYGAFLAYRQLAPALGLPARTRQDFAVSTLSTAFRGTNFSRTGFPLVAPDTIEKYEAGAATGYETYGVVNNEFATTQYPGIYFDEYLAKRDQYTYFLGQLQPYVTIYTGAATGKKLILFKDSYAHCLAPMLLADYSEIRLVDLRAFATDDYRAYVTAERYDQALFLYSTDTFAQQLGPAKLL